MPALVVIPARYASTRFPGKALATLQGKPIIQHVYENSKGSALADNIVVATDSKAIFDACESFGAKAVMTSGAHETGTDRIAEVAGMGMYGVYDIIVNVQGDEPLIRPDVIDSAVRLLLESDADIGTLAVQINDSKELRNPNVVKVVFGSNGHALYFSRSPMPYVRDAWTGTEDSRPVGGAHFGHIGIYSYRRSALIRLAGLRPSRLEMLERLEQLRALEAGMRIKVGIIEYEAMGIDTPDDLIRVQQYIDGRKKGLDG